ncbi:hypothetical protein ACIBKY_12815 [Nonomuraea sp. NPDC050394]|uniref:hypothetical protein n=1 Tax=Nonomuraea sp. NPDC050394 TaxID=3364363 RepID=UPI00379838E2
MPRRPGHRGPAEEETRAIGRVFGVGGRAERQVAAMRAVLDGVKNKLGDVEPARQIHPDRFK